MGQMLQKPHKTKKACDAAGNCEWVSDELKKTGCLANIYTGLDKDAFDKRYSTIKWRIAGAQPDKIDDKAKKETIDFFFKTKEFKGINILELPKKTTDDRCLPDFKCGSDHFEIAADVELSEEDVYKTTTYSREEYEAFLKAELEFEAKHRPKFSYTIAAEGQRVQLPNWGPGYRGTIVKKGERYDGKKIITVSYDSMFKCRNRNCTTPPREHFGKDRKCKKAPSIEKLITKEVYPHRLEWAVEARRRLTEEDIPSQSYLHSAEEVIARRRLVDHARMEAQDADAMSPSELAMHRRRLAHGARISPVLAALMDEIEEAKHNHA